MCCVAVSPAFSAYVRIENGDVPKGNRWDSMVEWRNYFYLSVFVN